MNPLTKHITTTIKAFKAIAFIAMFCVLPVVGYGSGSPFSCVQTGGNGNWNDGQTWGNSTNNVVGVDYPGPGDAVTIGNGRTITLTADASCGNLTLGAWGSEVLALNTHNLTVTGNITRAGGISITATTGYIIMAGTTQTITVNGGLTIPNLRLTNSTSVTMGTQNKLTITDNFDCQTGASTFTDNTSAYNSGSLTFASGSTCTAPNCTFTVANDHVAPAIDFSSCTGPVVVGTVILNPAGSTVLFGSNNVTTTTAFSGTNVGSISCSGTVTVGGSTPVVSVSATSSSICNGTSTTLTASGASTYVWSTGATSTSVTVTPSSTTTYTVTGTSSCGTGTATTTITVNSTPAAPTITTPVNYCQSATPSQLTATGTALLWQPANSTSSVGSSITQNSGGGYYAAGGNITAFTTLAANVTITSVDWYLIQYNSASSFIVSIQDATGATTYASSTAYSGSAGSSDQKMTATFSNCILASAGNYRIAITGGGNAEMRIVSSPSYNQTEATGTVNITGNTSAQAFTNLQFTIPPSSTAPTPSTAIVGSTNYYVTQTVGCVSPAATITVNVNANASIASVTGSSTISSGGTAQFTANTVVTGGGTGAWSSSDITKATVNSSTGLVTGVAAGTCNIIYTITGGCGGTVSAQQSVTVKTPSALYSTLTPTTASIAADGVTTQVLTVQAKFSDNTSMTSGGLTVTITKSSGTGTISSVTDNGNGTYTVNVTAPTSLGSGIFVATLGGSAVQSGGGSQTQATVTYIAGAPTQVIQNTADNQSGFLGCTVTTLPSVTVEDALGNPVSGVAVTFAVASGGGSITGATQTTGADGKATVGSWTLGTSGGANTLYANATAATSTATIQYPFPQCTHFKYPYGIEASHPNYGRLQSLVTTWIGHYYREGTLPNSVAAARVQWDDTTLTVSEGMGYGMVIMVYSDNASNNYQAKFNKLWQYYNYYKDGNGLMNWQISGFTGTEPGTGAATDADLDVALALIMAHKQWGSSTPDANGVTINYLACAQAMFHAIYQTEVDGTNHLLHPGDSWGTTYNPSYAELFAIKLAADEQTAGVLTTSDAWSTVYTSMQAYITHYQNATTGLLPNWTDPNATGNCYSVGYNSGDNKCGGNYDQGCLYGIDALRVPWRIAWDYSWYGTASSQVTTELMAAWMRGTSNNGPGNNPQKVKGLYNTNGTYTSECSNVAGTVNGMGYIGGLTHAFMSDVTQQANLDAWYEYIQDTTLAYTTTSDSYTGTTFTDYYNHTLQILYLLTISGNTPNFFSENPVISGSPVTINATSVSTVYSQNTTDLSNTAHWWTNTNGTGGNPCNFTTSGTTFIVQSTHNCTFNSSTAFSSGVTMQVLGTITPTPSTVLSGSGTLTGTGTIQVTKVGGSSTSDDFDNQYTLSTKTLTGLTVEMAGSATQYVYDANTFYKFKISNSNGVTLNNNSVSASTLVLNSGNLTLGSNTLTVGATTGGSSGSYVLTNSVYNAGSASGYLRIQSVGNSQTLFPLGSAASQYNPCYVQNSGTVSDFTARVFPGVYANGLSGTQYTGSNAVTLLNYTWEIAPVSPTGVTASITLQWSSGDQGSGYTRSSGYIMKNRHISGDNTWGEIATNPFTGSGPYQMTANNIATFSTFSGASNGTLPIELLSFTAKKLTESTVLNWTTATETNNDYFTLERSTDGVNWEEIYTCKGAGTSTIQHYYSFTDYEQQSGTVYYKLKQTDVNGDFTYSNIVSVSNFETFSKVKIYPNPFDGRNIYITGLQENSSYAITFYNVLGTAVFTTNIKLDGEVIVILDLDEQLPSGNYFIKGVSANELFTQQLLVK